MKPLRLVANLTVTPDMLAYTVMSNALNRILEDYEAAPYVYSAADAAREAQRAFDAVAALEREVSA